MHWARSPKSCCVGRKGRRAAWVRRALQRAADPVSAAGLQGLMRFKRVHIAAPSDAPVWGIHAVAMELKVARLAANIAPVRTII